jgi:hypothetical protein
LALIVTADVVTGKSGYMRGVEGGIASARVEVP